MTPATALRRGELSAGRLAALMNAPSILCLALVLAYPIVYAGYLSLHEVSLRQLRTGEFPFAGLANFARLVRDDLFWLSLRHTLVFVAVSVALEVVIALVIALIVNEERVWLSRVTRVLILVPWAVPPIVNGLLWSFILNAQYGYLNRVLSALGLIDGYVNWLGNPTYAMAAVIAAYVWRTTPFNILLYHAALQGIPRELYEAAEVDGASGWAAFWSLTLPLLRPIIAVTLILRTTFALHGVRRDPRHHPGRARQRHVGGGLVHLQDVVPAAVQHRPRRRLRVGAHADHRRLRAPLRALRRTGGWSGEPASGVAAAGGALDREPRGDRVPDRAAGAPRPLERAVGEDAPGRHAGAPAARVHRGQLPADPVRRRRSAGRSSSRCPTCPSRSSASRPRSSTA